MSEPQPVYTPPTTAGTPTVASTTDAHLQDLLELRAIAAGTSSEAYVWPKLMKRLGEMIARRTAALVNEPVAAILDERRRQDERWGVPNHEPFTWMAILSEEMGEAARAALHDKFGGPDAGTLRAELIQVAAVTIAWIESLDRNGDS